MQRTTSKSVDTPVLTPSSPSICKAKKKQRQDESEKDRTSMNFIANNACYKSNNAPPPTLPSTPPNRDDEPDDYRWLVETYDGERKKSLTVSSNQLEEIDIKQYDHVLDYARAIWAYRDKAGKWIVNEGTWKGLGAVTLSIIEAVQDRPGICMTPVMLSNKTGNEKLEMNGTVNRHISVLRRIHGENAEEPHFFVTANHTGLTLKWPKGKTRIRIKPAGPLDH